jgi:hypothetical protein
MSLPDTLGGAIRAPVGKTPSARGRLAEQRNRPLLVGFYASLFSDMGIFGGPARRRMGRFLLRSTPAVVSVVVVALVLLRAFEAATPGWMQTAGLSALAVALAAPPLDARSGFASSSRSAPSSSPRPTRCSRPPRAVRSSRRSSRWSIS